MHGTQDRHPIWSRNSVLYEINVRQFTPEGTFNALEPHLSRIRDLGIDIVWFMPIYPIGKVRRKGTLGSYYSISDYKAINPEFGTMDDFKRIVATCHQLEMKVLIDWVANHTAWDHHWVSHHPEYYHRDERGNVLAPFDWEDVAHLNYRNEDLRLAMIGEMKYWLQEVNIDGFRCDVADLVPVDFWNQAKGELSKIKSVFMLAESENPAHHLRAFDMSYGSEFHKLMNHVALGERQAWELIGYFSNIAKYFPPDSYILQFTSNHDENSWNGSEYERLGDGVRAFATLSFTVPGMPLVYCGQETGLDKRLKFFDKDFIRWEKDHPMSGFYKKLIALKKRNKALWNGNWGGDIIWINTALDNDIFSFYRLRDAHRVVCVFNFSDARHTVTLRNEEIAGNYTDVFTGAPVVLKTNPKVEIGPWAYIILEANTK